MNPARTISDYPLAIGRLLARREARLRRREMLRALFHFQLLHERLFPKRGTRVARIGRETVESNRPLLSSVKSAQSVVKK